MDVANFSFQREVVWQTHQDKPMDAAGPAEVDKPQGDPPSQLRRQRFFREEYTILSAAKV